MKHCRVISIAFIQVLIVLSISLTVFAQAQSSATPAPKLTRPEDEILNQMRKARNDPSQYVVLIVRLVKEFPETQHAESAGFSFSSALRRQSRNDNDPAKMRELAKRFIEGTASAPAVLRVHTNGSAVRAMLDNDLTEEAITLGRQTVAVLNEKEYLAFSRKQYDRDIERAVKANPSYKPRRFSEAMAIDLFRRRKAEYYSQLGRAYLKLDDLGRAEETYRQAYEVGQDAPAAAGIATILEKRGQDKEALEYLTHAVLTGKLDKAGIEQFHELYRRTHRGSLDGIEEYLDARYRQNYRSPVKGKKYIPRSGRTDRTVLAEFFTGAGCIPCIPFDYSFETALTDYSRREFILLAYHWHAPSLDPMGNRSSDARVKYYEVNSAPTVFLDGQKFTVESGGDERVKSEAEKKATTVYSAVTSAIIRNLETPSGGQLTLNAEQMEKGVKAVVTVANLKEAGPGVTLHVALVEEEVHYSGENGLRFHPMVVRSLARMAGADGYGFTVNAAQANRFEYVFDIDNIIAQNLRYYDEWPVERNKEVNDRIGGDSEFDVGRFKEHRHLINRSHLSIVAFLQDNKSKKILQSAFLQLKAEN
jgi:tetratricopeptide (TPR) repeat protein